MSLEQHNRFADFLVEAVPSYVLPSKEVLYMNCILSSIKTEMPRERYRMKAVTARSWDWRVITQIH